MPRITLYVSDSDLPIWKSAKAAVESGEADSVSALVTDALRERLGLPDNRMKNMVNKPGGIADLVIEAIAAGEYGRDERLARALGHARQTQLA